MHLPRYRPTAVERRFPRTRGDAPRRRHRPWPQGPLPPHTRGCTVEEWIELSSIKASPAHAGMHRFHERLIDVEGGFPRTRGDAPRNRFPDALAEMLPPHTRGCTGHSMSASSSGGASPAHAGMHRTENPPPKLKIASPAHAGMHRTIFPDAGKQSSFPRTRGDAPSSSSTPPKRLSLPPHTRGCTHERTGTLSLARASPAHAGMHPALRSAGPVRRGFPRTRGDAPPVDYNLAANQALPPHTRGCTRLEAPAICSTTASPAHAGMHPLGEEDSILPAGFPRTRGDAPVVRYAHVGRERLPPHTRGCTRLEPATRFRVLASPAHAGMHPRRI